MKFGKFIQGQQTEWGGAHHLNYKGLKKIINSVEQLFQSNPAVLSPSSPLPASETNQNFQALKTAFFFKLERELEKVNAFYLQKEQEFKVRLRSLVDNKRIIQARSSTTLNVSHLSNLREAFLQFQLDLTKLQNFVEINGTGFRKILKKWDKRAKSTTKEFYLSRQVEIQPCFNNEVLAELTDAATTNLAEIDALLEGTQFGLDSGVSVRVTVEQVPRVPRTGEDVAMDIENELVSALHSERLNVLTDYIEKRKAASTDILANEDPHVLSRVFYQVCDEIPLASLKVLLDSGLVSCEYKDDISNRTCTHVAAIAGRLEVLEMCTQKCCGKDYNANVNSVDAYGRIPVHYIAMYGWSECLVFILGKGSEIDVVDVDDHSPLTYAIAGGYTKCVELLLDNGASLDALTTSSNASPLSLACEYGHVDIARILLDRGAKVVPPSFTVAKEGAPNGEKVVDRLAPLHLAAKKGHTELCSLLLSHKAEVDEIDSSTGWTPLFFAASEGFAACVGVLLKAGAKANLEDEGNWTPLTYALYRGHIEVANLLESFAAAAVPKLAAPPSKPNDMEVTETIKPMSTMAMVAAMEIQPITPSALFEEKMELESPGPFDDIPSLSLPPPIIPFRIYGHNYLDKRFHVQVNLSNFIEAFTSSPVTLFGSQKLSSLKLVIYTKPDLGIPYNVILPLTDDSELFTFLVDNLADFSLYFDIYPTFGTKVLGRAVVLPSQLAGAPLSGEELVMSIPLFDGHLRVVGELKFGCSVVTAFGHPNLTIGGEVETYWKTTKVVNASKSHGDLSVHSFVTASSLQEEYIHVPVQLTADGVPVVSESWHVYVGDVPLAISSLTYNQAKKLLWINKTGGEAPTFWTAEAMISLLNAGSRVSVTTLPQAINSSFLTLDELFKNLPNTIGLSIEVKYPTKWERDHLGLSDITSINTCVDTVLKTVYDSSVKGRPLIFSSLNPAVCMAITWKQPNYGVFFKTSCGYSLPSSVDNSKETDRRCLSIKEALKFSRRNKFLGVICEAKPLLQMPSLIKTIKESGLILATFGESNTNQRNLQTQAEKGVDATIQQCVLKYNIVV